MHLGFSEFSPSDESIEDVNPDLIRLWIARAACIHPVGEMLDDIASLPDNIHSQCIGVRDFLGVGKTACKDTLAQIRSEFEARKDLERGTLFRNLRLLGKRLGLNRADRRMLAFRVLLRLSGPLATVMDELFQGWTDAALNRRLSVILGLPVRSVEASLSERGVLRRARLMRIGKVLTDSLVEKVRLPGGLIGVLMRGHRNEAALMSYLLRPVADGALTVDDYPHLEREVSLMLSYLRAAARERRKGVNVLLHGPPGTGKTELPRTLCRDLGWTLYDVPPAHTDRSITSDMPRLDALATIQNALCSSGTAAVLFDEVEQEIGVELQADSDEHCGKQFVNELLESNPVPTFWITNHPRCIDPAFMRRFDIVIAVGEPPRSVKRELLDKAARSVEVAVPGWASGLADVEGLTPAMITRFADVARMAGTAGENRFAESFELLVDQQFRALRRRNAPVACAQQLLEHDMDAINTSLGLEELAENVRAVGSARMLFHGLPGTGKSAFALALAHVTDRPVLTRQASDLLAPFLGETEQNIRESFARAQRDGALLLIDEADSFLQSRDLAVRNWEVSQVNEFLTQLERFEGIVVCTTNFMKNLDPAALRRFDVKIEFRALQGAQALRLFRQLCARAGITRVPPDAEVAARLGRLQSLTPGDFATVARRMRLVAPRDIEDLFATLAEEQRLKPDVGHRTMGFVA